MKRVEIQDKAAFKEIVNVVRHLHRVFPSYMNEDADSIILYLITLSKFGFLKNLDKSDPYSIKSALTSFALEFETKNDLVGLYDTFSQTIYDLKPIVFIEIARTLHDLNSPLFDSYFPEIFEQLLQDLFSAQGRKSGESVMPYELSRFMCNISDIPKNGIAYNPFSGTASFGVHLNNNTSYIGQEINRKVWAIGVLRLFAHQKFENAKLLQSDSIENWQGNVKYDLIISQPPFGLKLTNGTEDIFGQIKTAEQFLIEKSLESLKQEGQLILCISQNLLFNAGKAQRNLRSHLIENDLLEMVIRFPEGILSNARIQIVVLVISKNKKEKELVKFIDANEFVNKTTKRELKLDDFALLSGIRGLIHTNCVHTVYNQTIIENDFMLSPQRYFHTELSGSNNNDTVSLLKDLGNIIQGQKNNEVKTGKLVRIRDLKEHKFEYQLDIKSIENEELPKQAMKIDESCLLLAVRWKTLKPTFFKYDGIPIFITSDIVAFKPNEAIIQVGYLVHELYSDFVGIQLEAFRVGHSLPSIRREDLLSIKIKLPDYHYQNKFADSLKDQAYLVEKLLENRRAEMITQAGLEEELQRISLEQKSDLSIKKHNIMQHLNNVRESSKLLFDIMKKNSGVLDATYVLNPDTGSTVESRFQRLLESINESLFFVDNITNEMSWDKKDEFDIDELLKEANDKGQVNPNLFDIDYFFDEQSFQILADTGGEEEEVQDLEPLAEVSKKDFFEVYNNILENAICHGFTQPNKKYKFRIELLGAIDRGLGKYLTINFLNNGAPLPEGMAERYCIKGEKAGPTGKSGIGTWKVCEIVQQHFKGKVIVHDMKGEDFPVKIEIQLPWSIFKKL